MEQFFLVLFQNLVLVPAAVLIYLPMTNQLKIETRTLFLYGGALTVVLLIFSAFLECWFDIDGNYSLAIAMVIAFVVFHVTTKVSIAKEIFSFATAVSILSFCSSVSYYIDANMNPTGNYEDFTFEATVVQMIVTWALVFIAGPFLKKYYGWLMDNYHNNKIWAMMILIPMLTIIISFTLVLKDYSNVSVGRVREAYIIVYLFVLALTVFIYVLLYQVAYSDEKNTELQKDNQLLEIQAGQYDTLMTHVEEMRRVRHDFRQQLRVLLGLAKQDGNAEIERYISQYIEDTKTAIEQFSDNRALNSLLSYYKETANCDEIKMKINVDVSMPLPVSEIDFCSLLGNLIENSITASKSIEACNRLIKLKIKDINENTMAINIENNYNGTIKKVGARFISTTHEGSGIGVESIKSTVKKYNGAIKIDTDNNVFSISILFFK